MEKCFSHHKINHQSINDVKEFMGSIATEYGISYETQRKYLAEFEDYGLIEISGGRIRLKSKEGSGAIPTT